MGMQGPPSGQLRAESHLQVGATIVMTIDGTGEAQEGSGGGGLGPAERLEPEPESDPQRRREPEGLMPALARMPDALDEAALVERARAGDREAFDALARVHLPRIYSVLFRLLGTHEDAEDLAQECFVRAHRSLRFYRGEGAFIGWLVRIAVHLARDHARSGSRGLPFAPRGGSGAGTGGVQGLEALAARGPAPWQELSRRELVQRLARSIDTLPEPLRIALVLRVLEGMEYEEVAQVTGLRPATVRTKVMKARKLLARLMGPFVDRKTS
jgi:RNA polymerase sigma-70 factor (ECF subfamily)